MAWSGQPYNPKPYNPNPNPNPNPSPSPSPNPNPIPNPSPSPNPNPVGRACGPSRSSTAPSRLTWAGTLAARSCGAPRATAASRAAGRPSTGAPPVSGLGLWAHLRRVHAYPYPSPSPGPSPDPNPSPGRPWPGQHHVGIRALCTRRALRLLRPVSQRHREGRERHWLHEPRARPAAMSRPSPRAAGQQLIGPRLAEAWGCPTQAARGVPRPGLGE